ncbi:MAG: GNAT family N-acetyltransferase [Candidatus Promineifilaceae bacterium]
MDADSFGLPRQLDGGLVLRWATQADAEELVEFNYRNHNDNPDGRRELWLKDWTRELTGGDHPTTGPGDFTVVVDEDGQGRIVSAAVLISQVWSYDGLRFGCGRPELIATVVPFRRRGLVRAQMAAIHAKSASRGELVQAITGIPWLYRQFGYEMAVDLGGSRFLPISKIAKLPEGQTEEYTLRPATLDDIPDLDRLYDLQCAPSLLRCERDEAIWRYEILNAINRDVAMRNRRIIERLDGQVIGYAEFITFPKADRIREIAVYEGQSMRDVCWFLARQLKQASESGDDKTGRSITGLTFSLGRIHPAYDALGAELREPRPPYAWYIRVADLPELLSHFGVVLERRLRQSAMAGYSGLLRLNFYVRQLTLTFEDGKISEIGTYEPKDFFDGDAYFPGLTFHQLLFGYRSLEELKFAHPDCFTEKNEAAVLLPILFPKRPSYITMLS